MTHAATRADRSQSPPARAGGLLQQRARPRVQIDRPLVAGGLVVDLTSYYAVSLDGTPLELSPRQVEQLALFLSGRRRFWSREQLH